MKSSTPASRYTGSRSLGGAPAKITVTFGIVSFNSFASGGTQFWICIICGTDNDNISTTFTSSLRSISRSFMAVILITSKAPTSEEACGEVRTRFVLRNWAHISQEYLLHYLSYVVYSFQCACEVLQTVQSSDVQ